jgi:uncharacterized damage-inducible protein DinB
MNGRQAIEQILSGSRLVLDRYLADLSDEDLYVRPIPEAHTIAWQLGHLILSEHMMLASIGCETLIDLPKGFEGIHSNSLGYAYQSDTGFRKSDYEKLRSLERNALLNHLSSLPDADLALPGPEHMRAYAPTVGSVFIAVGSHEMLHAGQIVVSRRKLGKDISI